MTDKTYRMWLIVSVFSIIAGIGLVWSLVGGCGSALNTVPDITTTTTMPVSYWQPVGSPSFSSAEVAGTTLFVSNGIPYVAYCDINRLIAGSIGRTTVIKYISSSNSWEVVGTPGFSACPAYSLSFFMYNGTPNVAYGDYANGNKATVMKYNGSSWEAVGTQGFSAGEVGATSLYVDSGIPYVAYVDYGNGNKATVMKYGH